MIATDIWEWILLGGPWQLMIGGPMVIFVLALIWSGIKTLAGSNK